MNPRAPLVLVACGKLKLSRPSPAGELYIGPYAKVGLRWARSVTLTENIWIISARYGLVNHDTVIEPYEATLGEPGSVRPVDIRNQAVAEGILWTPAWVVGGQRYANLVRLVWGAPVNVPFQGTGGQGSQMRAMKAAEGRLDPTVTP